MRNKRINHFIYFLVTAFLFLITISLVMGDAIPPNPTDLGNSTGKFYVNFTWNEGSGNVTDLYNVSYNGTWDNTSSNTFRNESVGAHGYLEIIVYAYNSSDGGALSGENLTDNVTVPNNAPVVTNVSLTYEINETETLYIDADYTDADSDTGTFADNSSEWDINTTTGVVSWVTDSNDEGTYNYYINVSDGYGSVNQYNFTVTVNPIPFTIALHSTYPTGALPTNYTGVVSVHYIVQHNQPLNFSSLAFLYGINYTVTGDMHSYIKVPENSIADDGIYRGPYRNRTPYLSWEFNDTITNNNVWQWGGYDNDSVYVSNNPIDSTHAWVNVTGSTQEILSSSFYIARQSMYESPKTGFEINKAQGIIIKIWDVEKIRGRDSNYLVSLVFDTDLEATPSDDALIRYCNASFDPDNDDPRTSSSCQDVITADSTRWMNHTWIPHANSSYSKPLVIDASNFNPTVTGFLYLSSGTTTGKSFILNATNYDPGVCNRTFAQTESMWTFNEIAGASTAINYTPSFFAMFARDYMEMEFKFYIADNQGDWAYSGIDNKSIGLSQYPVDPVTFEFFNISYPIEGYIYDDLMDATYNDGYMNIGLYCPGDPDGGNVSHNVTVHYANGTLAGIVNNTLTTNGSEHVEINFSTTPYYSTTDMYILKCVSTDDEGSIVTKWLDSKFTLAADGTQGWVKDDMLLFWGMNNISTLYSTVNNDSYISYNSGNDIYTMHVPFFKSKCNDTFYFNETVHLESLNDTNISFFRFSGCTVFDNATILGWNTTSDTVAPDSDAYRGYLFSCCNVCGNIENSNFSYLGSDNYREEGLNFIGNTLDYLIYNTTFSHNAEGVIMEECSNFNISHCTISDNVNVGVGVYYSNDIVVANNTIDSNGGSGLIIYEGSNNIIRYNDITNSGTHGVRFWSNSLNNTCIGNDVTGSTTYDYYLTSSSLGNFIIDPASVTNKIRSTSSSSVNIENTDNTAFTEDSLSTSYAYLTNFSMFVSGASQTFDITQRNITILPSTDKLSVWNVEWDTTAKFNISSETANNPTWFNLTNNTWASKPVDIYRNGTLYANEMADGNGSITYNYSDSYSEKWFEFQEQPAYIPPNPISLTNNTGNYWVRYDWSPGSGNVTDNYNVSYNGTWDNTSSNTFRNESVGVHGYLEIIVYAWNNSGGGTLSAGYLTDNVTVPNNPINITNTSDYSGMENVQALIDFDYTDPDNDTPVFQTNATVGSLNSSTGVFTWMPTLGDARTYYFEFNVSDGYGSVDSYISTFEIIEFELTNPNPLDDIYINKGERQTFSISVSVSANSTWTLDGELQDITNNSMNPSYTTPDSLGLGEHTLIINASAVPNSSITEEHVWNFIVRTRPATSGGKPSPPSITPGVSNEPLENVLCSENGFIRNIKYGNRISYAVRNDDCLNVTSISFVPTVNSKGESVYIEALKDRSIFIARSVPNYELFNFNLFIGLLGYDSKTEEEKITFKVKKANIKNAGLDENSIKLYRWSTEKRIWIRKYTDLVNSDEYFYYYESDSGTTSGSFAVSGTEFIPEEPSFIEEFIQKIPGLEDVDLTIPDVVKDGYGNLGVVIVFILSSLVIGAVSIYYNSGKWVISMMISVLLIGIIYIFLGSNMISIFNSNIINLLINAALISLLSCLSPGIFEGIKEKLEAN
ncbi:PGF-pre-PGF domain-containing protein [Candidatus Dependentiae bacterium]|nr:PGF-pre-PGF domain-containing protein [Candidatus Dependentiae bacterium]